MDGGTETVKLGAQPSMWQNRAEPWQSDFGVCTLAAIHNIAFHGILLSTSQLTTFHLNSIN